MRRELYRSLCDAFAQSGVSWQDCYHEDRGDGMLVLVPPEVPKQVVVAEVPRNLAASLAEHNQSQPAETRIRLRLAVHAGEIEHDEHGVVGNAINLAFRLLEAKPLKRALASSSGVLAIVASQWFYEEVIRNTPAAAPASYRRRRLVVKETDTTGWICLPGHLDPVRPGAPGGRERPVEPEPRLPDSMPRVWNIPARNPGFTGRDQLLAELRERLVDGKAAVVRALHGMGGVGKTQLAAEYAHRFAGTYDLAWWINSEQAGLIGDQFAALGVELRCVPPGASTETVRSTVLAELRSRSRWLLVFDNAETPADITGWLPGGSGHVLITSRERCWDEIAAPVEVDVMARPESVAILQTRVAGLRELDADRLAAHLGDLPLAIVQAAGFMAETGMAAAQYLSLLHTRAGQLLQHGTPESYPRSLAAVTQLIADRLAGEDPAAAELASLCAFLAPEPIPGDLITGAASELPGELAARAADSLAWRQTLAHIARQSLARIDHRGLQMHKLAQAILRDRLTPAQAAATRLHTEAILAASNPKDPANPATWSRWAELMPHLLAADLAATDSPGLRLLACDACWYLIARGDNRTAHDLSRDLCQQWRDRLGDDHEHVLAIVHYLGWVLRVLGRHAEARDLAQDTLDRRRHILGDNHPETLRSAHHLAADLRNVGEVQASRDLAQDTLDRRRRVLGEDHRETLYSANNLGATLRALGEVQAAHDLDQDTLDRKRRVLGEDHPSTLTSANNLALDLRALGEVQAARDLDQDTLELKRRILGENHPDTLFSAHNLAADLRALGEVQAARKLDQDTLDRRRRVLGEDHPETLASAQNLAADLLALGDVDDDFGRRAGLRIPFVPGKRALRTRRKRATSPLTSVPDRLTAPVRGPRRRRHR